MDNKNIIEYTQNHNHYFKFLKRCLLPNEQKTFNLTDTDEFIFNKNMEKYFLQGYLDPCKNDLFFYNLNYYFITLLYHLPLFSDYIKIIKNNQSILEYIESTNEFKYLENQRLFFKNLSFDKFFRQENKKKIKIKYYGPVGKSGYSKITRNIIKGLFDYGIEIYFIPLQFQDYSTDISKINQDDYLLSYLSNNKFETDYIIIHSIPECWPSISKFEKQKNPNCLIYTISVWELEDLPLKFLKYIQYSDKISVPSSFSAISFKKHHPNVDIIHHPIFSSFKTNDKCLLHSLKNKYKYIFYNISEWTNRKGITELIEVFSKIKNNDVLLYLKTFGDITEIEGEQFIKNLNCKNIILDYKHVTDEYINCIHECGNCYISLTKSEGHGIGVCEAALNKKHIIITNYSGFLDYLKDVDLINYTLEPATFCTTWSKKHEICSTLPHCNYFDLFLPSLSSWANPNKEHALELMNKAIELNLSGNIETFNYLQNNFNKEIFCHNLIDSVLSNTKLIFNKNKIINSLLLYSKYNFYPQIKFFNWNTIKKTILLSNASGMGNVGDQLINNNIIKYFEKDYNLINIADNCIITKEYEQILIKDYNNQELLYFDYFIYGGGGLLRKNLNEKNSNLFFYTNLCNEYKRSYYILGCGFQDIEIFNKNYKQFEKLIDIFTNSNYISVRSICDYSILKNFLPEKIIPKINYYPDIGYINNLKYEEKIRNKIIIIPTKSWCHTELECIKKIINKNKKLKIYLINFGSDFDNDFQKCDIEKYLKIYGIKIYSKFLNQNEKRIYEIYDIWKILLETKILITGRYHGTILGKLARIPEIETFNYNNYKFKAEEISNHNLLPIETLNILSLKQLEETKFLMDNNLRYTFQNWDDTKRNENIVKLNKLNEIDICLIQNYSNYEIEKELFKFGR